MSFFSHCAVEYIVHSAMAATSYEDMKCGQVSARAAVQVWKALHTFIKHPLAAHSDTIATCSCLDTEQLRTHGQRLGKQVLHQS